MPSRPRIAISILHWGEPRLTLNLVESLLELITPSDDIFVVDNACNLKEFRSQLAKRVHLLEPGQNLGYSGGNNLVLEKALQADYTYVLLLNNDTLVSHADFLDQLVEVAEAKPKAAAFAPTILYKEPKDEVWFAGGSFSRSQATTTHFGLRKKLEEITLGDPTKMNFLTGCCLLIRVTALREIGVLDDALFVYKEDLDWCARAIDKGFELLYVPKAIITHDVSSGLGVNSPLYLYYNFRNNLLIIRRYVLRRWRWLAWLKLLDQVCREYIKLFVRYKKSYAVYIRMITLAFWHNLIRRYGQL